jgi:formyl-CoA transferase
VSVLNDDTTWPPEPRTSVKYSYYETKDGRFMLLQALERHFWEAFCDAAERPDLRDWGDWSTSRMDLKTTDDDLRHELIEIFRSRTQKEWTDLFISANIAGAPYYSLAEAPGTELYQDRRMFLTQENPDPAKEIHTIANAIKVDGDPFEIRSPAPEQGQHTDEILSELGFSEAEISGLRQNEVI